jgi:hypothetical protein
MIFTENAGRLIFVNHCTINICRKWEEEKKEKNKNKKRRQRNVSITLQWLRLYI